MSRLEWSLLHELKAILIYKKTRDSSNKSQVIRDELAKDDIFPENSFSTVSQKISNIEALDAGGSYDGYSKQLELLWDGCKDTSTVDIEKVIEKEHLRRCIMTDKTDLVHIVDEALDKLNTFFISKKRNDIAGESGIGAEEANGFDHLYQAREHLEKARDFFNKQRS